MGRVVEHLEAMELGIGRVAGMVPCMPQTEVVLTRMLLLVGTEVAAALEHALNPYDLNESDFRVLLMLFSSPNGCAHPGDLCQYATQKPTNMTRISDNLVRAGLITRAPSEADRRRIVLSVTPSGRRFVHKLLPLMFPHVSALFQNFSKADKAEFDRLLHKLVANLDRMNAAKDLHA